MTNVQKSTLREAAEQALAAMEAAEVDPHSSDVVYRAIEALRAALEEPGYPLGKATTDVGVPVYVVKKAEPVQEPVAVPLAEWQINDLMVDIDPEDVYWWSFRQGVYAAEKHHGIRS